MGLSLGATATGILRAEIAGGVMVGQRVSVAESLQTQANIVGIEVVLDSLKATANREPIKLETLGFQPSLAVKMAQKPGVISFPAKEG